MRLPCGSRGCGSRAWPRWDHCGLPDAARCLHREQARSHKRRGFQFQSFRTTFLFHSRETSEKIPLACACSNRGIVSAHRCQSAVGFSRPTCTRRKAPPPRGAFFRPAFYGGRAQGAFGRAGFRTHRSTNLRTATTLIRLVANGDSSLMLYPEL